MDYPLEMRTERALGILGRLIFDWAENAESLPEGCREEPGRVVIKVETFHQLMQDEGLSQGDPGDKAAGDYAVRADVREVELIRRTPERASILLPETDVVRGYRKMTAPVEVPLANLYKELAKGADGEGEVQLSPARDSGEGAIYAMVRLESDPLEAFIYPNTGYYSCTQCL